MNDKPLQYKTVQKITCEETFGKVSVKNNFKSLKAFKYTAVFFDGNTLLSVRVIEECEDRTQVQKSKL